MERLTGKVAIVTGASSGIGAATALALAEEGAAVVLVARRAALIGRLVDQIAEAGGKAEAVVVDVADDRQVASLVQGVRQRHGRIDLLINNAGIMLLAPVAEADPGDWRRMLEVNLLGVMYMTQAVLPAMKQQGGGHIVNVSSLAGRVAMPGGSVYSVTKFGVVAFSEALRKELVADRIRVTVVEPGPVTTELNEHITHVASKERVEGIATTIEQLHSDDIAAAIVYAATQPERVNVNEILVTPSEYVR